MSGLITRRRAVALIGAAAPAVALPAIAAPAADEALKALWPQFLDAVRVEAAATARRDHREGQMYDWLRRRLAPVREREEALRAEDARLNDEFAGRVSVSIEGAELFGGWLKVAKRMVACCVRANEPSYTQAEAEEKRARKYARRKFGIPALDRAETEAHDARARLEAAIRDTPAETIEGIAIKLALEVVFEDSEAVIYSVYDDCKAMVGRDYAAEHDAAREWPEMEGAA